MTIIGSRRFFTGFRAACVLLAVGLLAWYGPRAASALGPADVVMLAALAVFGALAIRFETPAPIARESGRAPHPAAPAQILDIPFYAASFALYGWYDTAAIAALAVLVTRGSSGRYSFAERLLAAGTIVPCWFVMGALRALFMGSYAQKSLLGFGAFVAMTMIWTFARSFLWVDVLAAWRRRTSLSGVWRNRLRHRRRAAIALLQICWGYVIASQPATAGIPLAVATCLPVPLFAIVLRRLHAVQLTVRRLILSRDALDAMIGAVDALPQIRSILANVHPDLLKDSLEILVFAKQMLPRWHPIGSVGPPVGPAVNSLREAALRTLVASPRSSAERSVAGIWVGAFPAFDEADELVGALLVFGSAQAERSTSKVKTFRQAARELAPLLRDFRVIATERSVAATDTLTGLANRRTISDRLTDMMRLVRGGVPCALLLLDIDRFKTINDHLGHQAGDRVLERIGAAILASVRGDDHAGRFGGEEFLVTMPHADRAVAAAVSERLREAVENCGCTYADGRPVTISIGFAIATPADTPDSIVARADRALYAAKREGRNRVAEGA